MYKIVNTDNRDPTTTVIQFEDSAGNFYDVKVNPVELFKNMLENLPEPLGMSCLNLFWVIQGQIEKS